MRILCLRATASVCFFLSLGAWDLRSARAASSDRLLCVVPLTGSGTPADPRRPLFASVGSSSEENLIPAKHADPSGPIAFSSVLTDDGQHAIVEFVAPSRTLRKEILVADPSIVRVFEHNKMSGPELQKELRRYKKDFDLKNFVGGAR